MSDGFPTRREVDVVAHGFAIVNPLSEGSPVPEDEGFVSPHVFRFSRLRNSDDIEAGSGEASAAGLMRSFAIPEYAFCAAEIAVVALDEIFPHKDLTALLDRISGGLQRGDEDALEVDEAWERIGDGLDKEGGPSWPDELVVGAPESDGADNERVFMARSSPGDVLREDRGRLIVCDAASGAAEAAGDVEEGIGPEGVVERSVTGSSSTPSAVPTTSGAPGGGCTLPFISSSPRP